MFGEDVVLVDTTSGQVTKVLSLGEDEVRKGPWCHIDVY
jgi:hypothetical protein